MAYFNTNNVSVFPSAFRVAPANGKYTSEENFINIINSIVDGSKNGSDGYIIDYTDELRVIIHGYYFSISGWESEFTTAFGQDQSNIWLNIVVEDGDQTNASNALVTDTGDINLDSGGVFRGINFTRPNKNTTIPDGCHGYSLQITGDDGKPYLENTARINSSHIWYDDDTNTNKLLSDKLDELDGAILKINGGKIIEEKQDKLSFTDYITIETNQNPDGTITSTIKLTAKGKNLLDQLAAAAGKGSNRKHVYIDSNGNFTTSTADFGGVNKTETKGGTTYTYNQNIFTSEANGLTGGYKVYVSTAAPDANFGSPGDFWFKYTA